MRKVLIGLVFVFSMFCLTKNVWGQAEITTGSIQGTVVDEKGGAVPDASVEVKNLDTNLTKMTMTGSEGQFQFLALPPGRYSVTIAKSGFATIVEQGAVLTVGQTMSLPATVKVSAAAEQIEVTAEPDHRGYSGFRFKLHADEIAVENTPVLGRKFEDLLTLTPGVRIVQGPDGDEINFNGQRGIFNNISLDGGDYNNGFFGEQMGGQRAAIDITLDAVKEFQVVASGSQCGIWKDRRRRGQCDHQIRDEQPAWKRLRLSAARGSELGHLGRQSRSRISSASNLAARSAGRSSRTRCSSSEPARGSCEDLTRDNLERAIGCALPGANPVVHSATLRRPIISRTLSASGWPC